MKQSYIFTREGDVNKLDKLHDGKPFFRKETNMREIEIVSILRKHPHPNIVTYYTISPKRMYIDMELLNTKKTIPQDKLIETMKKVKDDLQSLGIMYVDWKPDQMGLTKNGTIKLFDFNASGRTDVKSKKWISVPPSYWSYRQAEAKGLVDPYEIDEFTFTLMYPPKNFKSVVGEGARVRKP